MNGSKFAKPEVEMAAKESDSYEPTTLNNI